MISTLKAARALLEAEYTFARMSEYGGSGRFHWAVAEDGEIVEPRIIKRLVERGEVSEIRTDLAGDVMQYGRGRRADDVEPGNP